MSREARFLLIAVFLLVGLGWVMTYSASAIYAEHRMGNPQYFFLRQAIYTAIGVMALFAAAVIPARTAVTVTWFGVTGDL